ncbi:hypothetical protein MRB53_001104 [Persea americana]|uniref:Uncharacterized protein n=1 Tax=Persea americana TaxID=3435 RepID=A0ACC2MRR5_PERAE|nr:hypothetical protein MRB53_001104 [Persea americana]
MKRERKRSKTQKGCCWKKRAERASLLDKKSIHQEIVRVKETLQVHGRCGGTTSSWWTVSNTARCVLWNRDGIDLSARWWNVHARISPSMGI